MRGRAVHVLLVPLLSQLASHLDMVLESIGSAPKAKGLRWASGPSGERHRLLGHSEGVTVPLLELWGDGNRAWAARRAPGLQSGPQHRIGLSGLRELLFVVAELNAGGRLHWQRQRCMLHITRELGNTAPEGPRHDLGPEANTEHRLLGRMKVTHQGLHLLDKTRRGLPGAALSRIRTHAQRRAKKNEAIMTSGAPRQLGHHLDTL
mmetsp:Transcript_114728/g.244787  ORF Transcript_114728/g.244787 Transcript_114728/m.244787 type:complete len:206 (-) Transcript_114728:250-867(-)